MEAEEPIEDAGSSSSTARPPAESDNGPLEAAESFPSSSKPLDPKAPEFHPASAKSSGRWGGPRICADAHLDLSLPAQTLRESQVDCPGSLIFGGGGSFLSKYRDVKPGAEDGSGSHGEGSRRQSPTAPERVHVQLNSLIVNANSAGRILQVVESHFDEFNAVNLITALHRLATLATGNQKVMLRRDNRLRKLLNQLSDTLLRAELGHLKPQDLSNVAWAFAKLGLLNAVLFRRLSAHIMQTLSDFEPVNLSMTLWAFARSGFMEKGLFAAATAEVKRLLPLFQPQQIANTTWALAKSNFVDQELFAAAAEVALERLDEFQPMNYSMLVYSFAIAQISHPQLFEEVALRCTVQGLLASPSPPHVVTNLALAFSEVQERGSGVFELLAQVACRCLHDFRPGQIATLAQAFARAQVNHERLFACITKATQSRHTEFSDAVLQDIRSSFEVLGRSDGLSKALRKGLHKEAMGHIDQQWLLLALAMVLVAFISAWRFMRDRGFL